MIDSQNTIVAYLLSALEDDPELMSLMNELTWDELSNNTSQSISQFINNEDILGTTEEILQFIEEPQYSKFIEELLQFID